MNTAAAAELLLQKTRRLLLSDNGAKGQMVSVILVTNGAMLSYGETLQPDVGGDYPASSCATVALLKPLGSTRGSNDGFFSKTEQEVRSV